MTEVQHISAERLNTFFRPQSIALVGATDNSRWSLYTYDNLKSIGFPGPVYLVNPVREVVHGERAFKSLHDLPGPVDLAYIMVSSQHIFSVVGQAAEVGIRNLVVLTAGFSEIGEEGSQLERDLLAFAQEHDILMLGPNCNGYINVADRITPYGLPVAQPLNAGPVGIVLQSGALASAVLAYAQAHAIGLSFMASMGNESMISVTDVVDYLLDDEATRSIALFLESIRYPDELRRVAEKARARHKPMVALKIGRSELSSRTAMAHTGALVGNDAINDAALRQLGILRVDSLEDLLTTAGFAGYMGVLPGRKVGVVTPSGGACDIISDLAHDAHIVLPDFAPETVAQLRTVLPAYSTPHNPLDVTGYVVVDATLQQRALEVVVNDPNIDFVLNMVSIDGARPLTEAAMQITMGMYDNLLSIVQKAPLPVVMVSNTCLDLPPMAKTVVERTGLHFGAGMEHGIRGLGRLIWWSEWVDTPEPQETALALPPIEVGDDCHGNWSEARARKLLEDADLPIVPAVLATSAEEAVTAATSLGFPVAIKIQSPTILHKSDVGGVMLNLADQEAVRAGFTNMLEKVRASCPLDQIEGVLVSPMRQPATELLVGVVRDPLWGLVLTIGLGGIWTEALKDSVVRVLPVTRTEIQKMFGELRGAAVLQGARGRSPADVQALSEVIQRFSTLAMALGEHLNALEINPLRVDGAQIEALDVLVSWQD